MPLGGWFGLATDDYFGKPDNFIVKRVSFLDFINKPCFSFLPRVPEYWLWLREVGIKSFPYAFNFLQAF